MSERTVRDKDGDGRGVVEQAGDLRQHLGDVGRDEVALLARQISLVLVGAIILSSIRLVLRGVARVGACYAYTQTQQN